VVSGLIWVVAVIVFAVTGRPIAGLLFALLPILGYGLYRASCVALVIWEGTVNSAFDLYRFDLKEALNLQLPEGAGLSEERSMWQRTSEFLASGALDEHTKFDYTSMYSASKKQVQKRKWGNERVSLLVCFAAVYLVLRLVSKARRSQWPQ
jgi:hypothetical protein